MIDVASHVISQKSLKRKLFSAISALVLLPVGHMLPFAVVEKLHLMTPRIDYNGGILVKLVICVVAGH